MTDHKVNFDAIDWIDAGSGVRYKAFHHGNQRLRLVEFSEGFEEADWCKNGHAAYVLDGSFVTDFNGKFERHSKGDIVFIPSGEADKHKAVLGKGEQVTLLMFEVFEG